MEKEKVIPTWVGILNLVLVIVGIAWTLFSMCTAVPPDGHVVESEVIHALTIILLLAALFYSVSGYKKSSARYFNGFIYLYTVVVFVTSLLIRTGPIFLPLISILSFGMLCVLAFAKDIGKEKSFVICGINVLLALVRIIAYIVNAGQFPGGMFSNLLLAVMLGIMVYAKYADKTARGTK